jgi:hypothetical protein
MYGMFIYEHDLHLLKINGEKFTWHVAGSRPVTSQED